MGEDTEYASFLRDLSQSEMLVFRAHQKRIVDRDKEKRRRAKKEYLQWLDYLLSIGRISPRMRTHLEYYRMLDRHV